MMHDFHCTHDPCKCEDSPTPDDLLYTAWTIIANGQYWDETDDKGKAEWDAAKFRWRDEWHKTLGPPEALQGDVERFYQHVLEAVGSASVAWHDNGVFDEEHATRVARTLIDFLCDEGYVDKFYQKPPQGYDV